MFFDAVINGKVAKSMIVDIGAIHNFCLENEARRLSLKLHKNMGKMKAVNSKP